MVRYGTKNLIEAANSDSIEAQLLTTALLMLHKTKKYELFTPDELLRELIHFHQNLIEEQRNRANDAE